MGFREHIQKIVDSVPGVLGCTLMGFDGIAIDSIEKEGIGFDIPTLLIELSAAATQLRTIEDAQGVVEELTVTSHLPVSGVELSVNVPLPLGPVSNPLPVVQVVLLWTCAPLVFA